MKESQFGTKFTFLHLMQVNVNPTDNLNYNDGYLQMQSQVHSRQSNLLSKTKDNCSVFNTCKTSL